MAHLHHHDHFHETSFADAAEGQGRNLALAFLLNLFFCIVELVGGIFTNSVAILSDALHDLGDSVSIGIAWYLQRLSRRKPDVRYTYGYKRFSTLSALLNSLILTLGSGVVLYESIRRLFEPASVRAEGMLILAIAGVLVNGLAFFRLRRGNSLNERVVGLHLLEDVLGWVAVLVASIIMLFVELPILDPLLSIGISLYILYNVQANLRSVFRVILQGKPEEIDADDLKNGLLALPGVEALHDWHIWTMDNEFLVLTVHLVMTDAATKKEQQTLRAAAHKLLKEKGIQHATIEIESASENCEWCEPEDSAE